MVGVVVPRESFSLDYFSNPFHPYGQFSPLSTCHIMFSSFFLVSSYYGLRGLGLKGGILSRTVHSHRSRDIPQPRTDVPTLLYIVVWIVFLYSSV